MALKLTTATADDQQANRRGKGERGNGRIRTIIICMELEQHDVG
jgi:hypothetical protein